MQATPGQNKIEFNNKLSVKKNPCHHTYCQVFNALLQQIIPKDRKQIKTMEAFQD